MKKLQFKIENGVIYSAEKPKDERRSVGLCFYCRQDVWASSGQAIKYLDNEPTHKRCRPN